MFFSSAPAPHRELLAVRLKTEIPAEKWQHVILESFGYPARVSSLIDLEAVLDSVLVKSIVQLAGVDL
jgi:hypothetical protein